MTNKHTKIVKRYNYLFYKEIFLASLAVLSVYFVFYEYIAQPSEQTISAIGTFEIIVACIFLFDFFYYLVKSKNKKIYFKNNWYMLLASIPILDSWAELLRGLRMLELVRLIQAEEHLKHALRTQQR